MNSLGGCKHYINCFTCPFRECIGDTDGLTREVGRLSDEGYEQKEISSMLRASRRQVEYAYKLYKEGAFANDSI